MAGFGSDPFGATPFGGVATDNFFPHVAGTAVLIQQSGFGQNFGESFGGATGPATATLTSDGTSTATLAEVPAVAALQLV